MAYLITGVPGFLGKRLVRALLGQQRRRLYLLCERRFESQTRDFVAELSRGFPAAAELCRPIAGDITLARCGLDEAIVAEMRGEVRDVYHLAAVYDIAVEEAFARRVNVEGTRNVIALAEGLPGCRLHHVSSCFVAGERTGMVFEDELERGQRFRNHYEATKYDAERLVRAAAGRLEVRIFRPAVVIGDSRTGETDKFDGPYFAFRALLMGLLVALPGPALAPFNVVPVDFVTAAMAAIPRQEGTAGKTFQLADPNPLTARELTRLAAERMGAPRPRLEVPPALFKLLLRPRALSGLLGIPLEAVDYFNAAVAFDTTNARSALEPAGIACPPLPTYLNVILRFFLERAEVPWSLAHA